MSDSAEVPTICHHRLQLVMRCQCWPTLGQEDTPKPSGIQTPSYSEAMDDSQRAQNHELWLEKGHQFHRKQLRNLRQQEGPDKSNFCITRKYLMLLTLKPSLLKSLRKALQALPAGVIQELHLLLQWMRTDRLCRNPPSDEALLATATELARIVSSISSLRLLRLKDATASITLTFLSACSRVESVHLESCAWATANVRATFSITTLRNLFIDTVALPDSESIAAFCAGMEHSNVEKLWMYEPSISPEHEAQVATTLARCKNLVNFDYQAGASESFFNHFNVALSNIFDTKLERLRLYYMAPGPNRWIDLEGDRGRASGVEATITAKIRNLLKWNVQRKTCPPLFAAIGNAETDAKRKQCLVDAFEAVDLPVVFEHLTANENNMIELIQRLGRSRKRHRED